ncbi:MAG TPA: hypothetical protein VFP54_00860 [Acidimicrobiales bacterium]|nr:hypothetical protein [Acidimicrobiales bacterium]
MRTQAVGIHVADSTTQIQVADPAALTQIARNLGAAIIQGQDGWEGVCGADVLYWAVTVAGTGAGAKADWHPDRQQGR